MRITSPDFKHGENIPSKFTSDGEDTNPSFEIWDIPKDAKSLVLIVEDPDAPGKTFVHWLVWNIPIIDKIYENNIPGAQGLNDAMGHNYKGPAPPSGTHRYFFRLFALDTKLELPPGTRKANLETAMQGHILQKADLMGMYAKK